MGLGTAEPSEFGLLEFCLPTAPISQRSTLAARKGFLAEVRKVTAPLGYILHGDVQIKIDWFSDARLRCETDRSPDIDNILKPLLDGLSGRDGILIDDHQIQSLTSSWIDWNRNDQKLDIRIRFVPDFYLPKAGLAFVRVTSVLCFPIPFAPHQKSLETWLDAIERALKAREEIAELTENYYPTRYILPRRLIHRSRIRDFPVYDFADLRASNTSPTVQTHSSFDNETHDKPRPSACPRPG